MTKQNRRLGEPVECDWWVRRAEYLRETCRFDQLAAEGLQHVRAGALPRLPPYRPAGLKLLRQF